MTEEPGVLVSVVIVTHNGCRYVARLLASLLDQDFPAQQYQIIVVDNGSQDGTPDLVAQRFPSVHLERLGQNCGPGPAVRRIGHLLSQSRYLAYLNQDVIAHRGWLSELLAVMQANPKAGIVASNVILPQWPEYEGQRREGPLNRAYVCDFTPFGTYDIRSVPVEPDAPPIPTLGVCGVGFLLDLRIREVLGYLADPGIFAHADDMDLGLRVNASGYQVLMAPQSVAYHDSQWRFRWDRQNLRRAYLTTQNTILAFYKVAYPSEFVVLLPRLLLGKILKAGQHSSHRLVRLGYAAAATPMVAAGLVGALLKMPSFRGRRRTTLDSRVMPRGWLVDRLLRQDGQSNAAFWNSGGLPPTGAEASVSRSAR